MARLTIVDPAQATGETKELLDAVKASMGAIPNLTKALRLVRTENFGARRAR
jgi:hypothetical protein